MDVSSLVHLFFNNPTFSDITMVINDEPLYLHKIILAQSPKFAAAFKNGEDHHNTIVLENYDFSREMKSFLRSLYDGNLCRYYECLYGHYSSIFRIGSNFAKQTAS